MKSIFKLTTLILVSPSLFTFVFPNSAKANNQFDVCLKDLITAGVTTEQAQTGCADALVPRELSTCVRTIATGTDIKAIDALKSCYQVRRPVDMGNCVVNINKTSILKTTSKSTLEKKEVVTTETETNLFATTEDNTLMTKISPVMMALNTCQASLLPARHSECVIALSRTPQVTDPTKAMTTCLSAEDFPRDLFPSYQK
ncbi:hypothetical protein GM3708_3180 [Geminocystis sp. NIES-3708]|uniref:hypothetical protein n=1 Tax=Geminocystis sp. NIES-3708 TaxID=1615909 RepID=UPI0005FC5E58|nr:hypothetical protein [Geminocystis sp. NIES-3708]BAQ62774.1 hypothetical protein GM3708_3180 [Geminocystis sp. NIES-3708]